MCGARRICFKLKCMIFNKLCLRYCICGILELELSSTDKPSTGKYFQTFILAPKNPGSAPSQTLSARVRRSKPGRVGAIGPGLKPAGAAAPGSGICPHCLFFFSNVSRHVATIHLKLRPYKCFYCHKSFSQSGHRLHHMRAVHSHLSGSRQ